MRRNTSAPGRSSRWYVLASRICEPASSSVCGQLRLHRRLRADRHEERRLHLVVQGAKGRRPGARIARQRVEAKIQARRHNMMASVFLLNLLRTLPARDDELCERRL